MSEQDNILNNYNKRQKPAVPADFFENFAADLEAKILEQETGLSDLKKADKPMIPEGFFESFEAKISPPIESRSTVIRLKVIGFVTAVAATLLVMLYFIPSKNETTATETAENTTEIELTDDELLAYVDGDDILDFVVDNEDIDITTEIESEDAVFYFLEDEIEELYFEEL